MLTANARTANVASDDKSMEFGGFHISNVAENGSLTAYFILYQKCSIISIYLTFFHQSPGLSPCPALPCPACT
jgi:hypothetical protein